MCGACAAHVRRMCGACRHHLAAHVILVIAHELRRIVKAGHVVRQHVRGPRGTELSLQEGAHWCVHIGACVYIGACVCVGPCSRGTRATGREGAAGLA
eukprot:scaffold21966_cov61-Phaeocystis_antarctica.AAC.1